MIVRTRPVLLAGGVAAALLLVVLVAARNEDSAAVAPVAPRRPAAAASGNAPPVPDVKLEILEQSRSDPGHPARNPFRFEARAMPRAPESFDGPVAGPPPSAPPPMFQPSGPPPPSPIPLRFIGLFDAPAQSVRVAVLSDGRGNVFYGKEGDIIEGRYKVLGVGADTVELSYLDGRGRQTIRLTGQ